jgi:hypothetical protein
MKKIMFFLALTMCFTGSVYAAALTTGGVSNPGAELRNTSDDGPLIGKLSAGVRANIEYDANSYAVATAHDKGTKIYATAAGDTKIYTIDKAGDAIITDVLTASDTSAFDTGWTEM